MKMIFILLLSLISFGVSAQVYFKGEYIGSSTYKDEDGNKAGKGDAKVVSGGIQIPLSIKMSENNRPIAWGIGLGGSYTSFGNKNMPANSFPSEILNAQFSLTHMRPISKNWSIIASLGAGTYMGTTDLSKVKMKNILIHGGVIFVWHLKDNLAIGVGPVVNTSFGYPMAFPAFYVNWELRGKYEVKVSMLNAFEVSAGMQLHKNLKLKVIAEMNGAMALEKIGDKDMVFSHQYIITGIQPEFVIGKKLSIPITAGISATRNAFYQERSLKAFFKNMDREHDPYFGVAPYVSVALKYQF